MSLNKTLDRLFDEIRREAKRNPDFADRLDAVLRLHDSRRDVADEVVEGVATQSSPGSGGGDERSEAEGQGAPASKKNRKDAPLSPPAAQPDSLPARGGASETTVLNPAGLYKREGEDALTAALGALDQASLRALITEHNLDPSGVTGPMDDAELATHIIAQAKRRAERDEKMFDY